VRHSDNHVQVYKSLPLEIFKYLRVNWQQLTQFDLGHLITPSDKAPVILARIPVAMIAFLFAMVSLALAQSLPLDTLTLAMTNYTIYDTTVGSGQRWDLEMNETVVGNTVVPGFQAHCDTYRGPDSPTHDSITGQRYTDNQTCTIQSPNTSASMVITSTGGSTISYYFYDYHVYVLLPVPILAPSTYS
jgi:hypothetical protein